MGMRRYSEQDLQTSFSEMVLVGGSSERELLSESEGDPKSEASEGEQEEEEGFDMRSEASRFSYLDDIDDSEWIFGDLDRMK